MGKNRDELRRERSVHTQDWESSTYGTYPIFPWTHTLETITACKVSFIHLYGNCSQLFTAEGLARVMKGTTD
jgi:hypothetical protein